MTLRITNSAFQLDSGDNLELCGSGGFKFIPYTAINTFCISFGRDVDSMNTRTYGVTNYSVAEIDYHLYYEMNEGLRLLAEKHEEFEILSGYEVSASEEIKTKKIADFFTRAEEKSFVWDAVRNLKPIFVDVHCYPF